ncbi:hypothetical protein D4R42_01250 [bacterium]|nr:MAG: hypothetical protein D4R42_01250 [bacterium]
MNRSFITKTIPELLKENGFITAEQLSVLEKESIEQGRLIEDIVLEQGIITEEELLKLKAKVLDVPYVDLMGEQISVDILKEFPKKIAVQYNFIPFKKVDNCVYVAMADPEDTRALEALKFIALRKGIDWKIFLTSPAMLEEALHQYSSLTAEVGKALEILKEEKEQEKIEESKGKQITAEEVERIAQEAPISKVVSVIMKHAVEGRASDVHIEPVEKELRVRYRVDGLLYTSLVLAKRIAPSVAARIKVLSNLKLDEQRIPQDGRFHMEIDGRGIDLRVSTLPIADGEKVVIRILDKTAGIKKLVDLGFDAKSQKILEKSLQSPYGTILVTGPTGSGKSTTLYAMMNILNSEGVNIITLEDPVEYRMEGINQSQIRPKIGYTFASGLRSILRQDPDVIMVGEIRDGETAELSTHAALTGHLVLSTLHTNSAVGAIPRLIDMGIEPFLLSSALNVIIAQRLAKRICEHCKEVVEAPENVIDNIKKEMALISDDTLREKFVNTEIKLYKGKGCKHCSQKGTKGRVAINEVLVMTPNLAQITSGKPSDDDVLKEATAQGMITMKQNGFMKAIQGIISLEEVLKLIME